MTPGERLLGNHAFPRTRPAEIVSSGRPLPLGERFLKPFPRPLEGDVATYGDCGLVHAEQLVLHFANIQLRQLQGLPGQRALARPPAPEGRAVEFDWFSVLQKSEASHPWRHQPGCCHVKGAR